MTRKLRQLKIFAVLGALIGVLLIPAAAVSQERAGHGVIELGVRQFWGDVTGRPDLPFQPDLYTSKFNEYRDVTNGLFIRSADLSLEHMLGKNNFLRVQGQSGLRKDQAYLVTFDRPNKFQSQFGWDETPHTFTNTAKFLYTQPSPGVYTLPANIRGRLIAATRDPSFATQGATNLFGELLAGVAPLDMSLHRKTATGSAAFNLAPDWSLGVRVSREKKTGYRPFGTYSPGVELPEPIDYRSTGVQATTEYGKQRWGIQFDYLGSIFENKINTVVWDNDAFTSTPTRGQIDLYPDNSAHNSTIAGAVNISSSTRVMASIVPGWMRQNDAFVPHAINPPLDSLPLPARSLDGSKQTLAMNYALASRPVEHLELTARYRSYDYNNNTPSLLFPIYVLLDGYRSDLLPGTSRRMPRQSLPYEFSRKNVELAASWEFVAKNLLKAGYEFEKYDREHRDVRRSDENAFVTSLDLNPSEVTLLRISYRHSGRSPDLYVENTDSFPLGLEEARQQLHEFRRFDEVARVRDRAEALVQFSPLESVSVSGSYGTTQDDYNESRYGLLKDISYHYTFDVDYIPRSEFSLFAEYARERYRTRQRSRLSCAFGVLRCEGINNSPNNDWESSNRNVVDTWTAGIDTLLAEGKVNLSTFYSMSASYGSIRSQALGDSRLPGFLLDSGLADCRFGGCTAENYPNLYNRLHDVVVSLKVALPRNASPKLEYRYEQYGRVDWQTERMQPYMFGVDHDSSTQIFLGADAPSYRAHVLAVSLEYRF